MSGIKGHIGLLMGSSTAPPVSLAVASYAKSNSSTPQSSQVMTTPTGLSAGDLIIAFLGYNGNDTAVPPAGFTLVATGYDSTSNFRSAVFQKVATGSEGSTLTFTSPGPNKWNGVVFRIVGSDTAVAAESAYTSMTSSSPQTPPSLTPSWGATASLWLSLAMGYFNNTMTGFAFTDDQDQTLTSIGEPNMFMSTEVINTGTVMPGNLTWSGGGVYGNLFTVGVKPL